jgi:hypothetical protein
MRRECNHKPRSYRFFLRLSFSQRSGGGALRRLSPEIGLAGKFGERYVGQIAAGACNPAAAQAQEMRPRPCLLILRRLP